jgi:hypothetical protein
VQFLEAVYTPAVLAAAANAHGDVVWPLLHVAQRLEQVARLATNLNA